MALWPHKGSDPFAHAMNPLISSVDADVPSSAASVSTAAGAGCSDSHAATAEPLDVLAIALRIRSFAELACVQRALRVTNAAKGLRGEAGPDGASSHGRNRVRVGDRGKLAWCPTIAHVFIAHRLVEAAGEVGHEIEQRRRIGRYAH